MEGLLLLPLPLRRGWSAGTARVMSVCRPTYAYAYACEWCKCCRRAVFPFSTFLA